MPNPYQKPLMMPTNQAPQGLPLEWVQMPGQEQEQQQMDQGIAGLGPLLKRFQKPKPKVPGVTDSPMQGFDPFGSGGGPTFA